MYVYHLGQHHGAAEEDELYGHRVRVRAEPVKARHEARGLGAAQLDPTPSDYI